MEISDFLTILGIALAVWALIPNKERRFILLFFSKFEIIVLFIAILFIHYLMSFNWMYQNWISKLSVFITNYGIPSTTWAYIFSIIVILYPIIKVTFGYFARSRVNELINLYDSFLKENEIDILVNYIQKYHIQDIKKYLIGKSQLPNKDSISIILRQKTKSDIEYQKLIKPKRILFAAYIYGNIIQNDTFISIASNKYPELFAEAIAGIQTVKAVNPQFVKLYINCIFDNKNQSLIQELKILDNAQDSINSRVKFFDLPICYALFAHTKAAYKNNVWYPVGENTIKSLKYDEEQKRFLLKEYDSLIEDELWNHKIKIAIVYFDYMVRETIYFNNGYHMWLFYFRNFIEEIVDLIPKENAYNHEKGTPAFAHFIIDEIFSIMNGWLDLSQNQNNDNRVIDTIRCIGDCLYILYKADEEKISNKFKINILDRIISTYFEFSNYPDNKGAITSQQWIENVFKNLKNPDSANIQIIADDRFLILLKIAWEKFDKIPYSGHEDNGSITRFNENILLPLDSIIK